MNYQHSATTLLMLLLSVDSQAQTNDSVHREYSAQVEMLYTSSLVGSQILLNYHQHWGRHALVAGLKYFFDARVGQHYSRFAGWQLHKPTASSVISRIGLSLGYEFHFSKTPPLFDLYLWGQLQHENYLTATHPTTRLLTQGPFTVLEAVAGMGVQRAVYTRVGLNASAGIGSAFFISDGFQVASGADGNFSERTIMLRIGVWYAFR